MSSEFNMINRPQEDTIVEYQVKWSGFDDMLSEYSELYKQEQKFYEFRDKLAKKSSVERLQRELQNDQLSKEQKLALEEKLQKEIQRVQTDAAKATIYYTKRLYMKGSADTKVKVLKDQLEIQQQKLKDIDEAFIAEYNRTDLSAEQKSKLVKKHKLEVDAATKEELKLLERKRKLEDSQNFKAIKNLKENAKSLKEDFNFENLSKVSWSLAQVDLKVLDKELDKKLEDCDEELKTIDEAIENARINGLDTSQYERQKQAVLEEKNITEFKKSLVDLGKKLQSSYQQAFKEAETMITEYKGIIDARLQGSNNSYNQIMDKISSNLSLSPFVRTTKVIEKMRDAVDKGIAYNVEQRAFLATISDKIANTFDAFDSNLTRLIRLQQADTTAARLGMEASLTKFFNNMFQDTSYLSDMYDSVSAAIIDANASLSRDQSAEFEYIVQKWLGSLGSLGMSSETITNIASGLNYIATGDVTSLSNNTQLQTLFAMSASKAGLEYSDLLLNGLNADNTNALLESMVIYLKEIAENSDSQVVRSAYGDIFNMSLSDMKAISNLSNSDISNISSSSMTYGAMNSELNNQMLQVIKRTSLAESLSNLYENAIFGVAEDMASNPATWAMTKMLDFMEGQKLDMAIPFVNAMGFGVDLNTSVQDIMRLGVGLSQAFSLMGNILGGLGSAGGLNLNAWGATEYTQRGSGMSFTTGSTFGTTSGSTYVSTSSSQDMKNSALSTAADEADETSNITNKNAKVEHTFDDFYNATIGESAKSYIRVQDVLFEQVYNSDQNFLGSRDSRMTFDTEGNLNVSNSSMGYMLSWLFGTNPLHEDGRLKVNVQDKTFRIKPEDNVLPVHIASIAESIKSASSVVTLSPGTNVSIDETTLVNAFKKAMGYNKKSDEIMNIGDLIELLQSGSIVIPVTNPVGKRIQVDTELSGTSGYVAGNRVVW